MGLLNALKGLVSRRKRRYRDAITGHYVTQEYAEANPETTVSEATKPRT